jgi:phage baseplate assembly protein W
MPTFQTFKDVSVTFGKHPNTDDVLVAKNETAIKIALQNLVMTRRGERPFQPLIGSRIPDLLFDLLDFATAATISDEIYSLVDRYERRIRLVNVNTTPDYENNSYDVYIEYEIIGRELDSGPLTTELLLQRTR